MRLDYAQYPHSRFFRRELAARPASGGARDFDMIFARLGD